MAHVLATVARPLSVTAAIPLATTSSVSIPFTASVTVSVPVTLTALGHRTAARAARGCGLFIDTLALAAEKRLQQAADDALGFGMRE
jgi:hypothetical protein